MIGNEWCGPLSWSKWTKVEFILHVGLTCLNFNGASAVRSFTLGWCILDECFWLCLSPLQCLCRSKPVRLHLSAAARWTLLIMGRTPHRGRPSCDPSSARPVALRLILKRLNFDHKDQNAPWCFLPRNYYFFWCLLPWGLFIFPLLLSQVHFFAFICTVIIIILCVSVAPKSWWAVQSSSDFRSEGGEGETKQHHSRLCPRQI